MKELIKNLIIIVIIISIFLFIKIDLKNTEYVSILQADMENIPAPTVSNPIEIDNKAIISPNHKKYFGMKTLNFGDNSTTFHYQTNNECEKYLSFYKNKSENINPSGIDENYFLINSNTEPLKKVNNTIICPIKIISNSFNITKSIVVISK